MKQYKAELKKSIKNNRFLLLFCLLTSILLCLTAASNTASAATYYIADPKGADGIAGTADDVDSSDSYPGTSEQPWQTMERAMSDYSGTPRVGNGDTVYLRSGNYGEVTFDHTVSRTSWDDGITYKAESVHTPVLTSLMLGGYCDRYLEFDGIDVIDETWPARLGLNLIYIKDAGYLKFKNMYIKGNGNAQRDSWDSWTRHAIFAKGTSSYYMRYLEIDNCEIIGVGTAVSNTADGFHKDIIITNNSMHDFGSSAIAGDYQRLDNPMVIEGNHIYNQLTNVEPSPHGTALSLRFNPVVVRNNIIHNYGRTTSVRTGGSGTPPDGVSDYIFENNLIYDNLNKARAPVWLDDIKSNLVFNNNTVIGSWEVKDDSSPGWRYKPVLQFSPALNPEPLTWEVYNNVLVGRIVTDLTEQQIATIKEGNNIIWSLFIGMQSLGQMSDTSNSIVIIDSSNNYKPGYDSSYFEGSGNFFVGGADFDTYSYQYPPAKYGGYGEFGIAHGVNLNDAYKLAEGSDAIGFANPAYAPATDILGVSRVFPPDAGCYEYVALNLLYGDVNGNGEVTSYDAALAARYAVGLEVFTDEQRQKADVSGNTEVSAYDAALIAQKAVGLIDRFPVEE